VTSWRSSLGGALPGFFRNILELRPAIGFDFRRNDRRDMRMVASGVPVGVDNFVDNSVGVNNGGSRISSTGATAGWYANTTIGLFSRIYFDLGLRQDIGSAIVSTNKARYPKIGTSWLMSDESFWKQNRFLETFRLRGAIGYAAVQPEFKDILGNYYSAYTYFDGQFVRSINISSLGNRGLLPERALEYELGFDATLFDDRLDLVATYARKENRNALVLRSAAPSVIPAHRKENVARIVNRNIELTANARLIETAALRLRTDYALTLSENWVAKLGNRVSPIENSVVGWIREGYPIGGIWNPVLLGYNDRNGDGLIADNEIVQSDSLVYIGWAQPRYRASYGLNVMIKNVISFDTRFAYQSQYVVDFTPSFGRGLEDLNASLAEQAVARVQQLGGRGSISDLRWNSASVTYHVSESIARKVGARSASISLQGSNLNLWTNYRGRDPSVNTSLASEISRDDGNILPVPRRFVLDFKVGF
jgi:outer membrane receptor protein involved in Fe transport